MTDDDQPVDLRKLANEAAQSVYSPRALRCWFPWSHRYTLWSREPHPLYSALELHRRHCLRCGKITLKRVWNI